MFVKIDKTKAGIAQNKLSISRVFISSTRLEMILKINGPTKRQANNSNDDLFRDLSIFNSNRRVNWQIREG